jgi:hypothetical protein
MEEIEKGGKGYGKDRERKKDDKGKWKRKADDRKGTGKKMRKERNEMGGKRRKRILKHQPLRPKILAASLINLLRAP